MYVCPFVRLRLPLVQLKILMSKLHKIFCTWLLSVAVSRSFSDDNSIHYVLPVLWMTLCYHIMKPVGQNERRRVVSSSSSPGGSTGAKSAVYDCILTSDKCIPNQNSDDRRSSQVAEVRWLIRRDLQARRDAVPYVRTTQHQHEQGNRSYQTSPHPVRGL